MLKNSNLILEYLAQWTGNYFKNSKKSTIGINSDFGFNSVLTYIICSRAKKYFGNGSSTLNLNYVKDPYFNKSEDQIFIGLIDKTDKLNRSYNKRGLRDIYPILDLYHSEVVSLVKEFSNECPDTNLDSIIKYEKDVSNIEWATKLHNGIVTDISLPNTHKDWYKFTKEQKEDIAFLHQRDKKTRHKCLRNIPYCKIRSEKANFFT